MKRNDYLLAASLGAAMVRRPCEGYEHGRASDDSARCGKNRGDRSTKMIAIDDFYIYDLCIRSDTECRACCCAGDGSSVRVA